MKKLSTLISDEYEMPRIDLSPMIDILFLLLIFFIVTAVFEQESGVDLELPSSKSSLELTDSSLRIEIDKSGNCIVDGTVIGRESIGRLFDDKYRDASAIAIAADSSVDVGVLVAVMDECRMRSNVSISLVSQREL